MKKLKSKSKQAQTEFMNEIVLNSVKKLRLQKGMPILIDK